jgi:uncharacterized membrane protein
MRSATVAAHASGAFRHGAFLLGFALGGFFDGILLHQVLQWHHLLSNVEGVRDLRTQILADGLFHVLMYVLAGIALAMLWRSRGEHADAGAGNIAWGNALLGFGIWNIVDIAGFHWLAGIHRIRVDVPNPMFWDLAWLAIFGVLPTLAGWRVRRRPGGGSGGKAAAALAITALVAGPVALLPSGGDSDELMVLFAPGVRSADAFNALARVDARVLWVDGSGGLWAVKLPRPDLARSLYAEGALLVGNAPVSLGCFSWARSGA